MNFGNIGAIEAIFVLLVWLLPFALLVWFIRTVSAIAGTLREIVTRLEALELAVRDASRAAPSNHR